MINLADTVVSSEDLKINWLFSDSDTRMTTIDFPRSDLIADDILEFKDYVVAHNIIVGDKQRAAVVGVKSAKIIYRTETKLDIDTDI